MGVGAQSVEDFAEKWRDLSSTPSVDKTCKVFW